MTHGSKFDKKYKLSKRLKKFQNPGQRILKQFFVVGCKEINLNLQKSLRFSSNAKRHSTQITQSSQQ